MISKEIVSVLIDASDNLSKDVLLKNFIYEFICDNCYNDNIVNHVLELLVGKANYIAKDDINLKYIEENISKFVYNGESYSFKDILIDKISHINANVKITYQYKDKNSEDNWHNSYAIISIIEYPECVKK